MVSLTVPNGTDEARLEFVAGPLSFTLDGTTPSSSVGLDGFDQVVEILGSHAASLAQFIRRGSINGTVRAVYMKWT